MTTDVAGYTTMFRRGTGWKRMVLRAVGNTLTASHYGLDENRENPVHDATEKVTLTGQDASDFGAGVRGDVGRRWVPSDLQFGERTTSEQGTLADSACAPQARWTSVAGADHRLSVGSPGQFHDTREWPRVGKDYEGSRNCPRRDATA